MKSLFQQKFERIKNQKEIKMPKDFLFGPISFFLLALSLAAGVLIQSSLYPWLSLQAIVPVAIVVLVGALVVSIIPLWSTIILVSVAIWLALIGFFGLILYPVAIAGTVGLFLGGIVQLILQWDKVVILRMGKFKRVHGAGLLLLVPLIDRIAEFVDTRIRATDFSAEKTLTRDTVPVHVDAIAFWMIWDAKHAILEVETLTS